MADDVGITASELDNLTAEDLQSVDFISVRDPENLAPDYLEKLRALTGTGEHQSVDLEAVSEKLKYDHPRVFILTCACRADYTRELEETGQVATCKTASQATTPDPNDPVNIAELRASNIEGEREAYYALIADGGRPSHFVAGSDSDFIDEIKERTDIISYWIRVALMREYIFRQQNWIWKEFREKQDRLRAMYPDQTHFDKWARNVLRYLQANGMQDAVQLKRNRKEQSRLDDWKGLQFYEHDKADRFRRKKTKSAQGIETGQSQLRNAIDTGAPAEETESIDYGLRGAEGRQRTSTIDLELQSIFIAWIDEQIPVIAAESHSSQPESEGETAQNLTSSGKRPEKRKRPIEGVNDENEQSAGKRKRHKGGETVEEHSCPTALLAKASNEIDRASKRACQHDEARPQRRKGQNGVIGTAEGTRRRRPTKTIIPGGPVGRSERLRRVPRVRYPE